MAPILVQCFFWADRESRAGWEKQLDCTGPGTFYEWLNAPSAPDEQGCTRDWKSRTWRRSFTWANAPAAADLAGVTGITNFILHICRTRTDVLGSFPHVEGTERRALVRSVVKAARALQMDVEYVGTLERSIGRHWLPESWLRRLGIYE